MITDCYSRDFSLETKMIVKFERQNWHNLIH